MPGRCRHALLIGLLAIVACDVAESPAPGKDAVSDNAAPADLPGTDDAIADNAAPADLPGADDAVAGDESAGNPDLLEVPETVEVADPAGRGPYSTRLIAADVTRTDRTIPAVAHVPEGPVGGSWPLVVFLPGFQAPSEWYQVTVDHLASHGFVVVRAEPPASFKNLSHVEMARDVSAVIDWSLDPSGPLKGLVDADRIGTAGHSLGGKLAVMAASHDARVKALFAIDPINGGDPFKGYSDALPDIVPDPVASLAIPLGFAGETWSATNTLDGGLSCAPADQNFTTFHDAATKAPWKGMWTFPFADHQDFVDDPVECGFTCELCPDGPGDDSEQVAALRTLLVAFFRLHFGDEAVLQDWLFGARLPTVVRATHTP